MEKSLMMNYWSTSAMSYSPASKSASCQSYHVPTSWLCSFMQEHACCHEWEPASHCLHPWSGCCIWLYSSSCTKSLLMACMDLSSIGYSISSLIANNVRPSLAAVQTISMSSQEIHREQCHCPLCLSVTFMNYVWDRLGDIQISSTSCFSNEHLMCADDAMLFCTATAKTKAKAVKCMNGSLLLTIQWTKTWAMAWNATLEQNWGHVLFKNLAASNNPHCSPHPITSPTLSICGLLCPTASASHSPQMD